METREENIENWYGWLAKRIPELEKNWVKEYIKLALKGCAEDQKGFIENSYLKSECINIGQDVGMNCPNNNVCVFCKKISL